MNFTLNLTYPDRLEGQEFLIETEPKQLKTIIDDCGESDLNSELIRVHKLVFGLNRCDLALSQFESILKILHEKYSSLSNGLRDYSLDSVERSSDTDQLMHELTTEMCFAFKSFVTQLNNNEKWVFGLSKKAAFGVNYALHYLTLLKAEFYQCRKPLPSYLWKEILQLMRFAEAKNLLKTKIKDQADNKLSVTNTVIASFSRAALMASIKPFDLSRKESWELFYYLGQVVGDNAFTSDRDKVSKANCFSFNYAVAKRPRFIKEVQAHDDLSRYIEIEPMIAKVKQELQSFNSDKALRYSFLSSSKDIHEKLLQHMYRYSVQYIARDSDRYPVQIDIKTLWGYSQILELLNSKLSLQQYPEKQQFKDLFERHNETIPLNWQTVNESKGGLGIQEQTRQNLEIPENVPLVVAKQLPNAQGRWRLAMTRWFKSSNGKNQLGVQYIKGHLQKVKLTNTDSPELIFIGPSESNRYFVLTPKKFLQGKKNLILESNHEKWLVNAKGTFACHDSDLVQLELVKKSS